MAKNICEVEGCEKYVVTHGLCDKHRKRMVRHGHLKPTRPNDWGNREKHPLYDIWKTKKIYNRSQDICKEWHDDFWLFVKDIGDRPSLNHRLRAIDDGLVIGPDNWHWVQVTPGTDEDKKAYARSYAREDRKRNPKKYKNQSLLKRYGITLDQYEQMQAAQDNKCAICESEETGLNPRTKKPRELAVDHCHDSGEVRGLLCSACNKALGGFKDDVALLERAISYIER